MHDTESEQDREDDVLGNFLFGNVDEQGNAEIDYLDKDAKESLKNVKGQIAKELLKDVDKVEQGGPSANGAGPSQPAVIRNANASDYADEQELIEDPESVAQQQQRLTMPALPKLPKQQAAPAADIMGFLADEDDYDEDDSAAAQHQKRAQAQPAIVLRPPTAVPAGAAGAIAPGAAAGGVAGMPSQPDMAPAMQQALQGEDQVLLLPALAGKAKDAILQLSDLFGMPQHEVDKYLNEPVVEDQAEQDSQLLAAARARRERRMQRLQEQQKQRQLQEVQPEQQQQPMEPVAEVEEDELSLLQQMPDDPSLAAHYRHQRALLMKQQLEQGGLGDQHTPAGPPITDPGGRLPSHKSVQAVPSTGAASASEPQPPQPSSQQVVKAPEQAAARTTEIILPPMHAAQPHQEAPLDSSGAPLVPATLQRRIAQLISQQLVRVQAPPLASDLAWHQPDNGAFQLFDEADERDSDEDELLELVGMVPARIAEPASLLPWEKAILWESKDGAGRKVAVGAVKGVQGDGAGPSQAMDGWENKDPVTSVFETSVQEAALDGQRREAQAKQRQQEAGVKMLGVPQPVFGKAGHPQMLRLVPDNGAQPADAAGAAQDDLADVAGPQAVAYGPDVPANQPGSVLRSLHADAPTLALPEQEWEDRIMYDATNVTTQASIARHTTTASGPTAGSIIAARSPQHTRQGVAPVMEVMLAGHAALPPQLRTPLLLDLNDPCMVFTSEQADARDMQVAAALIKPPPSVPQVKYGPPVDPADEVAKDLARFNVSKDAEYGHGTAAGGGRKGKLELRDANAQKAVDVKHAMPALTLTTFPAKLEPEELVSFHRPRGRWHPSEMRSKREPDPTVELYITMCTLTGRLHGLRLDLAWWDKSLADLQADPALRVEPRFPDLKTEPHEFWIVQHVPKSLPAPAGADPIAMDVSVGADPASQQAQDAVAVKQEQPSQPQELQLQCVGPLDKAARLRDHGLSTTPPADLLLNMVFPCIKLLPTKEANSVPTLESNKPLRPPAAFSKKPELTVKEGHVLLLEYMEERPALLGQPGMGVKLMTYYKKKDEQDNAGLVLAHAAAAPQQAAGEAGAGTGTAPQAGGVGPGVELCNGLVTGPTGRVDTWRVGAVQQLDTEQEPFLGTIKPGVAQLSVETLMFRAPAKAHTVQPADFLLIRSAQGTCSLREITGTVFVGQQQPLITVPHPQDHAAVDLNCNRLVAHVLRELRKKKAPGKGGDSEAGVKLSQLKELFPILTASKLPKEKTIPWLLKDRCGCQLRPGTGPDEATAVYEFAPGAAASTAPESDLRRDAPPDHVSAYESAVAAEARLERLGLKNPLYLANVHPDLIKLAIEMLPLNDPQTATAVELIEHELAAGLPYRTTEAFIKCVNDKTRLLNIDSTAGDPTGRGHGFAYVVRSEPIKPPEAPTVAQPELGSITGSDCDLRKLSNKEAAKILLDFGIQPEVINATTDRWKRIDMVRKLCTAANSDGVHSDVTRKFTRVIKYTFKDHMEMLRNTTTRIWAAQIDALGADTEPPGAAPANAMLNSLRADRLKAIEKGMATAQQRAKTMAAINANDDHAEYLRMQQEGFFDKGSKGNGNDAASAGSAVLEAKAGDKRIRRMITWTNAQGQQQKRELVVSDKADVFAINTMCKTDTAFGHRTLNPITAARKFKTQVPAHLAQLEMTRGGKGRAKGKGKAAAAAAIMPAPIRLPNLRGARGGGRGSKPRAARKVVVEDEEGQEEEGEEGAASQGGRAAAGGEEGAEARAKKRAARKPTSVTVLRCKDCGQVGHEAGSMSCPNAFVNPDEINLDGSDHEGEEGREAPEPSYRPPAESRLERLQRRQMQAISDGGDFIDDDEDDDDDLFSSPSSGRARSGGKRGQRRPRGERAPRVERHEWSEEAVIVARGKRQAAEKAKAGFARADSDEEELKDEDLDLGEEDLAGEEEQEAQDMSDEEIMDMDEEEEDEDIDEEDMDVRGRGSKRARPVPKHKVPPARGTKRTASGAGMQAAFTGVKRARPVQPAAVHITPADAQKTMSNIFKECIMAVKKEKVKFGQHKPTLAFQVFVNAVVKSSVEDYNKWVKESDEMWLDKILGRVKANKYNSRAAFLEDVDQIVINATRYHTKGHGRHAAEFFITLAQDLRAWVDRYLDQHTAMLDSAEQALQANHTAATVVADGAAPAVAQEVEVGWVQCDRCQKWRAVSKEYSAWVEQQGDGFRWFCEQLEGMNCSVPETAM